MQGVVQGPHFILGQCKQYFILKEIRQEAFAIASSDFLVQADYKELSMTSAHDEMKVDNVC